MGAWDLRDGPAVACPACSSTWRRSKTSPIVFPSAFAALRMISVAPQRTSLCTRHDMVDENPTRPAARRAALGPPERRSKDCRRRETPSKAPLRVETCEIRNQSAPEVAQGYEALVGPVKARGDGRRARTDAETASPGSPELHEHSSSTQSLPPFLDFDQS